jgi:predicted nucleic acid-binding protein
LACFRDDAAHRFHIVPVAGATFDAAIGLLLQHGTKSPLRTLDALQLASAKAAGTPELTFVTADGRLFNVASEIFPHVMNPETASASSP